MLYYSTTNTQLEKAYDEVIEMLTDEYEKIVAYRDKLYHAIEQDTTLSDNVACDMMDALDDISITHPTEMDIDLYPYIDYHIVSAPEYDDAWDAIADVEVCYKAHIERA